ncbi:MAG: DUF998 domain-containing protein [Sphingomonas sp.]|nr:DUF998 domain-containing protein [Sphingomonas sp.]
MPKQHWSTWVGILGLGSAIILVLLHLLKPDLAPTARFVSEYATGDYSWLGRVLFFVSGAAIFCVGLAYRDRGAGKLVTAGAWLHLFGGAVMFIAGFFAMDPMGTPADQMTMHGQVHSLTGMVGIPVVPIAALVLAIGLWRRGAPNRALLLGGALVAIASLVALQVRIVSIMSASPDAFPMDSDVGTYNRLWFVGLYAWLAAVWFTGRSSGQRS